MYAYVGHAGNRGSMGLKKSSTFVNSRKEQAGDGGEISFTLKSILENQVMYQKLMDIDISSKDPEVMSRLSEVFLFKMIEEAVELRKTIPSSMNKWEKNKPEVSRERILDESSDVLLFFLNFLILWDISPINLFNNVRKVQINNFDLLKKRQKEAEKAKPEVTLSWRDLKDEDIPF